MTFNTAPDQGTDTPESNQENNNQQQVGTQQQSNSFDQNEALAVVGDRTFKTQDDLAKYVNNASSHISTLEAENADLRRKVEEAAKLDELMQKLDSRVPEKTQQTESTEQTSQFSMDDVVSKAVNQVTAFQQQEAAKTLRQQRLSDAMSKAKEAYGDSFVSEVQKIAGDNGISDIDEFVISHPKLFDSIFISGAKKSSDTSSAGSGIRTDGFNSNGDQQESVPLYKLRTTKERHRELNNMYEKYGLK